MIAIILAAALGAPMEKSPVFLACDVAWTPPYTMRVSIYLRPGFLNVVTLSDLGRSSSAAVTMDSQGWHWEDYRHGAYGMNHINRTTLSYTMERDGIRVTGQCRRVEEPAS